MATRGTFDIFIQPGEYYVAEAGCRLRTLLGSCVSITLWHAARRVGAMSHFLLSNRGPQRCTGELDAKYGEEALALMIRDLGSVGIDARRCEAKIFGGGHMFPAQVRKGTSSDVGRKNGEAARELLRAHGIGIVSESLFGMGHRQIIFDVTTGHVWSRQIRPKEGQEPPKCAVSG